MTLERMIGAPDGRSLEVAEYGDGTGPVLLFHHGTPGSSRLGALLDEAALAAGVRVLCVSRPGYGRSSRLEGRDVASAARDARTVLETLGVERYATAGWSGGGPHALACAALDSAHCVAAWSLAGVAPYDAGFDWTAGMGEENIEEFRLALEGGEPFLALMEAFREGASTMSGADVAAALAGLLSPADLEALASPGVADGLAAAMRQGFAEGYWGDHDDDQAFVHPWGFDPASIAVPVEVHYGDADLMVPPTHGDWLAATVPTAVRVHRQAEGHLGVVVAHLEEICAGAREALSR